MNTYITRIRIDNFKSLQEFEMRLNPFNCLIGLNGVGKTTILQVLGFIGAVMFGSVSSWLNARGYRPCDILSENSNRLTLDFDVDIKLEHDFVRWSARLNAKTLNCSFEKIILASDESFKDPETCMVLSRQRLITNGKTYVVNHSYEGSALCSFQAEEVKKSFAPVCWEVRRVLSSIRSPDLLSPQALRLAYKASGMTDIGIAGKIISSYLLSLPAERREVIASKVASLFPRCLKLEARAKIGGWKEIVVSQPSSAGISAVPGYRLNDGLLRIIGILAQVVNNDSLLCIEEVENGINMDFDQPLIDFLINSPSQIVITTHSPQLLNNLPEELASEYTQLVFLDNNYLTRVCPMASLSSLEESLSIYLLGDAVRRIGMQTLSNEAESARIQ